MFLLQIIHALPQVHTHVTFRLACFCQQIMHCSAPEDWHVSVNKTTCITPNAHSSRLRIGMFLLTVHALPLMCTHLT
jgi:hypothetical protein